MMKFIFKILDYLFPRYKVIKISSNPPKFKKEESVIGKFYSYKSATSFILNEVEKEYFNRTGSDFKIELNNYKTK